MQTIQRLWQADPNVQVVICTAYSDYSWEEISKKLGLTDRLLILKKPFDPAEIIQIATSLSEKWSLAGKAQLKMDQLEHMVAERTAELVHTALHDKLTGLPNRRFCATASPTRSSGISEIRSTISRCFSWILTVSSWSTTALAMISAMNCWSRFRNGSPN